MLSVLEETSSGTQGLLKSNKADLGFSQGFITLGTDSVPFLKNRKVSKICFVPHQPNTLLSVHLRPQDVIVIFCLEILGLPIQLIHMYSHSFFDP